MLLPAAMGVLQLNSEADWLAAGSRTQCMSQIQTEVVLSNPDPHTVTNWSPAIPPKTYMSTVYKDVEHFLVAFLD